MSSKLKLTDWEWEALVSDSNLADGHAHHEPIKGQIAIVEHLPQIYHRSTVERQDAIQDEFTEVFFAVAGQRTFKCLPKPIFNYSCSLSIEIVANYIRLKQMSVALLHPTFDNLADILKRHQVQLLPIEEAVILDPSSFIASTEADSIFLVCPNNPTGLELSEKQFSSIVSLCKEYDKLLIIDFSFRFFSSYIAWDQYALLRSSNVRFIALEDTGKTWPTLDMKLGIIVCDEVLRNELSAVSNDIILNVSPFIFNLLTRYISVDLEAGSILTSSVIEENRSTLKYLLDNTPLIIERPTSSLSVAWIRLPEAWRSSDFCAWLERWNVHVLPGGPFYWNDQERGEHYVRIALSRPPRHFAYLAKSFHQLCLQYEVTSDTLIASSD